MRRFILFIAGTLAWGSWLLLAEEAPRDTRRRPSLTQTQWAAKIHAGWVGKVSAGSAALPTELWSREKIRQKYGDLRTPPQKPTPRGPLDDTTLSILGWNAAQQRGPGFTSADIARQWVDHLTDADLKGGGFGREFLDGLARLRKGERPPIRTGTPRAEWIAAQMRAEIWGMLAPGDPVWAANMAARDAEVLNVGNGVYAAQFTAALASVLMAEPDIPQAIAAALDQIPADSALAGEIRDVVRRHRQYADDWQAHLAGICRQVSRSFLGETIPRLESPMVGRDRRLAGGGNPRRVSRPAPRAPHASVQRFRARTSLHGTRRPAFRRPSEVQCPLPRLPGKRRLAAPPPHRGGNRKMSPSAA